MNPKEINFTRAFPSLKDLKVGRTPSGFWYGTLGEGPDLLLLPGFGADHSAWSPLVPDLKRRFRLILVDPPGVGKGPNLEADRGPEQLVDPLIALVDHLDIRKIRVLGASLGSWTGLELAGRLPDRIPGLVMAGIPARMDAATRGRLDRLLRAYAASGGRAFARGMVLEAMAPAFVAAHPDRVEAMVQAYALSLPPVSVLENTLRLLEEAVLDPPRHPIETPILILHGALDTLAPLKAARDLAGTLAAAELRILKGAGHHVLLERRTEALEAIQAFFAEA